MGEVLSERLKLTGAIPPARESILNILVAASHLEMKREAACKKHGITNTHYNVLRILRGVYPDGHSRNDLSARMIDRAPDVTRLIDRLVKKGFVERVRSSTDLRLSIACITPAGIEILTQIAPEMRQLDLHIISKLNEDECRKLSELCEKIYEEL